MSSKDPGPRPDPEIEPGEPLPGGADAVPGGDGVDGELSEPNPEPHDLDPDRNPAVEDALPDEMKETEDTDTEATKGDGGDLYDDEEQEPSA
jgi:hypothetical protein